MQRFVTIDGFAAICGCSRERIRQLIDRGGFPEPEGQIVDPPNTPRRFASRLWHEDVAKWVAKFRQDMGRWPLAIEREQS